MHLSKTKNIKINIDVQAKNKKQFRENKQNIIYCLGNFYNI